MRLKNIAAVIILSSFCLAGCNSAGGEVAADPSAAVSQEATAETISQDTLEAIERKTVDVKGYYITTDTRNGETTEKERSKEYKGYLKEIEVMEQSGEIITIKAYLVDSEDFFTTAKKVDLEYNVKDGNIQLKTDRIKIEPTVFFDMSMFFNEEYRLNEYPGNEKLPDMNSDNIKDIALLESAEDRGITKNDFSYNGYVHITDVNDISFLCTVYLDYKPNDERYSPFTREKVAENKSPIWHITIKSVKELN